MNNTELQGKLAQEVQAYKALIDLLEKEKLSVQNERLDEINLLQKKKEKVVAAISAIEKSLAGTGVATTKEPSLATLIGEIRSCNKKALALQQENAKIFKRHIDGKKADLIGLLNGKRVKKTYAVPSKTESSIFIDRSM